MDVLDRLCPICSAQAKAEAELGHAWVMRCRSADCRCGFPALKEEQNGDDAATIHRAERAAGDVDSPDLVFEQVLGYLQRSGCIRSGWTLLDFGCGAAGMYPIATRMGLGYTGVDIDPLERSEVLKRYGIKLFDALASIPSGERFDVITMFESIEHLPRPRETLSALRELLTPGGVLYLSTPNSLCLRARLQKERWPNYVTRSHLFYFTERSLRKLLRQSGFSSVERLSLWVRLPDHSFGRQLVQRVLLLTGMDGTLRFIARR